MTEKVTTEAEADAAVAYAFGRKPTGRVVSEAGGPSMSFDDALGVTIGAAFGRVPDGARLVEAERVLAAQRPSSSGSSSAAGLQGQMSRLMDEVSALSESRLGLSADRARLNAQSEALDARERSGSVAEAVKAFERYRDVLIGRPVFRKVGR